MFSACNRPLDTGESLNLLQKSPVVSRETRRHLVMPSFRSLVSSTPSAAPAAAPQPLKAAKIAMGSAASSSGHAEAAPAPSSGDESPPAGPTSRLIAPRPVLIPSLSSPKRPMKRDSSCGSLLLGLRPSLNTGRSSLSMRKCETVMALSSLEPIKPVNRLRMSSSRNLQCSRCSSMASMTFSSRYSINTVIESPSNSLQMLLCKICLTEVPVAQTTTLQQCQCVFCTECLKQYVGLEVQEAAYDIACPDAACDKQGILTLQEIETLVSTDLMEKHRKFRLDKEVDMDSGRTWCPRAGCETICTVCPGCQPQCISCPACSDTFCSNCKKPWHQESGCSIEKSEGSLIFDPERIKHCPMCKVPIEKDEGCAQMMCKRCKHVFCWYCLASLDDDFLLRHYDKGPCKNKLGHSRASVIWHRTQVIAIFAGFGILLLVASPLLLLAAPCIVCCKCRACQDKYDEENGENATSSEQQHNSPT
ncbi:probable E3 ubiquitin-protein ligase RNF144A-A [Neocloeon triangulifer]|uniref:probable E3 ubiquitin-protein ligase RNF144A-A n=1 Tax=Neocloeon triangulifer TaxID=2078957 RepID=UPI00286ECBF3|nr:probable E3 ubiquitin-protein ligase RNF144A-A [Neocloeon triangulifer]